MRIRRLHRRLREERGNAVVEFPLIAALVVALGLSLLQLALFLHVRNGLTDIAVQSAYHGALLGPSNAVHVVGHAVDEDAL